MPFDCLRGSLILLLVFTTLTGCVGQVSDPAPGDVVDSGTNGAPDSGPVDPLDAGTVDAGKVRDAGDWPFDYSWNPQPGRVTWLGMNVSGDLPFVDLAQQLAPFTTADGGLDAQGYPFEGESGQSWTDFGFVLPAGQHQYKISYKGTGTLAVSGIGSLAGAWTTVGEEHRNVVNAAGTPGAFGQGLQLNITNAPGERVYDIHLYREGYDYGSRKYFTDEFLDALAPFRALRMMQWQNGWFDDIADWSARAPYPHFGTSTHGEPLEVIVGLVNETGKDVWLSTPYNATEDYLLQMADFLRDRLDFDRIAQVRAQQGLTGPFRIYLEYCNEVWTGNTGAYNRMLAKANADPSRYSGQYTGSYGPSWMAQSAELMKVGQAQADTVAHVGQVFRTEFAAIGKADAIFTVLGGWALGPAYSDVGLTFVKQHYSGNASDWINAVAIAPYFGTDDANTGDLGTLFSGLNQNISAMDATWTEFRSMGDGWSIPIIGYEGGQGLTGTTNQNVKHLAQFDARMYAAYSSYYAKWKQHFGENLFNHYALSGTPGLPEFVYQYGYWQALDGLGQDKTACTANLPTLSGNESVGSEIMLHCPKWKALIEQMP